MIPLPRLLDDNLQFERTINPLSIFIDENIIPLSTALMRLEKDESIDGRRYVELFNINGSVGIFRTKTPDIQYSNMISDVTLEHAICEVGDWIISVAIEESVMSVSNALNMIFEHYRGDKWQLGTIGSTDNIVCNLQPTNLLEAILSIINQIPNYMLTFDFSTSPWTMNVVHRGTSVASEGRLSRNIKSATIRRDDSRLCTRVYLEGLPSLGDAVGHLDADTISTYGVIEQVLASEDYTASEAYLVAQNHLNRYKRPIYTVNIDGYDLSQITGDSFDRIALGKLYRLTIPDDGVVIEETITAIAWENVYDKPEFCYITLSEDLGTAIQIFHAQGKTSEKTSSLSDKRNQQTTQAIEDIELYIGDADDIMEQQGLVLDQQGKLVYKENETADDNFVASYLVQEKRVLTDSFNATLTANTWATKSITLDPILDTMDYMVIVCRDEEDQSISTHISGFEYEICNKTTSGFDIKLFATAAVTCNFRWLLVGKKGVVNS